MLSNLNYDKYNEEVSFIKARQQETNELANKIDSIYSSQKGV